MALARLSGIDGVYLACAANDFSLAQRLGGEFADLLRLLEELGWEEPPAGEALELRLPPAPLRRNLDRLRDDAERRGEEEDREQAEARAEAAAARHRTRVVVEASERILRSA